MIARIVFQGRVLQGDIIVSYILYNTAIIKTLLYNSYPNQGKSTIPIFVKNKGINPKNILHQVVLKYL